MRLRSGVLGALICFATCAILSSAFGSESRLKSGDGAKLPFTLNLAPGDVFVHNGQSAVNATDSYESFQMNAGDQVVGQGGAKRSVILTGDASAVEVLNASTLVARGGHSEAYLELANGETRVGKASTGDGASFHLTIRSDSNRPIFPTAATLARHRVLPLKSAAAEYVAPVLTEDEVIVSDFHPDSFKPSKNDQTNEKLRRARLIITRGVAGAFSYRRWPRPHRVRRNRFARYQGGVHPPRRAIFQRSKSFVPPPRMTVSVHRVSFNFVTPPSRMDRIVPPSVLTLKDDRRFSSTEDPTVSANREIRSSVQASSWADSLSNA
jgi:hypothetical protein